MSHGNYPFIDKSFENLAIKLFKHQARENKIYKTWLESLGWGDEKINAIDALTSIPFLPITAFKSQKVVTGSFTPDAIYTSSGAINSQHFVSNKNIVNKDDYLTWERDIGCRPNTGIIAILDILKMNPKELYITGFTLFKDGYSSLYRDNIDNRKVTEENSKFKVLDRMFKAKYKGAHDQYKIYLYLKNNILNKSNIKMDTILIDILNFNETKYAESKNLHHLSSRDLFIHYLYHD